MLTPHAGAAFTLLLRAGGMTSGTAFPDGQLQLELELRKDAAEPHTSAIFSVESSMPGLVLESYTWGPPYVTDGIDDFSEPTHPGNPTIVDGMTALVPEILIADSTNRSRTGVIDAYFENFLEAGEFSKGTLLTLNLAVPANFPRTVVFIAAVPDTFDDGIRSIPTTGGKFTLFTAEPSGAT